MQECSQIWLWKPGFHSHCPMFFSFMNFFLLCQHKICLPPFPAPGKDHAILSIPVNLTTLSASYKWWYSDPMFVLLCLAQRIVLKVQPCYSLRQNFIPFQGWIIFHCMLLYVYITLFVSPSFCHFQNVI